MDPRRQPWVQARMNCSCFAACALALAWGAFTLARDENEKGHYWPALVSGLMAIGVTWTAGFVLLRTDLAAIAYYVGVFVSLRIALEVGFSFSAIVCPES